MPIDPYIRKGDKWKIIRDSYWKSRESLVYKFKYIANKTSSKEEEKKSIKYRTNFQ